MKVTKDKLKQLISEEIKNTLTEGQFRGDDEGMAKMLAKDAGVSSKIPEKEKELVKADMSVEDRLASIEKKIDQLLANNNLSEA